MWLMKYTPIDDLLASVVVDLKNRVAGIMLGYSFFDGIEDEWDIKITNIEIIDIRPITCLPIKLGFRMFYIQ